MNILNTTSSGYFFSRTLNLIFSTIFNTKKPIKFVVWDIGLNKVERFLLKYYDVTIIKVPEFCEFWRDCYTWKTYIYKKSKERFFLHLDSGNTVLCDIDVIFERIKEKGYFFVDQGQLLSQITPADYYEYYGLNKIQDHSVFAAGNIGFDKNNKGFLKIIDTSYDSALKGMCLGYSYGERNRVMKSNFIIRDCEVFRHDQTVLNCCLRATDVDIDILPYSIYSAVRRTDDVKILNQRKISYEFFFKKVNVFIIITFLYCIFNDSFFYLKIMFDKIVKKILN
ncbi:hypothetical protein [Flavobacterium sp. HJJ]|uniref:hypothetical protein n=1 Tax=Flavobacterium sp. HJJ TaxID=2783792 RepID=UPI00188D663F|nr:hypothetical protein [Flavobacterium sp. HJJ]MBF4470271.1 hypothetical protein [Flavobacterium sp. HJJ]